MDKVEVSAVPIGIHIDKFGFDVKLKRMLAARAFLASPAVFDCHSLLNDFYNAHVVLGKTRRDALAGYRDANLDRLSAGLEKLGPIDGASDADFDDYLIQGSYAMHTLNQHPDNDYDIDTGVIFIASTIPASPKETRQRVARALREAGGNFTKQPEARTNAVTVWYAEGHHVDLAIYRRNGDGLEHAGGDSWNACDPEEIPIWFKEKNTTVSPASMPDQFRRVVRWLKSLAKSRKSWAMPGGMIMSALAAEVYQAHGERDDVALLDTLTALSDRLNRSTYVANPVGGTLTGKQKYIDRVVLLRDKLAWLLPKLEVLRDKDCTLDDAKRAWRWVFNHSFWETPSTRKAMLSEAGASPATIAIRAEVALKRYDKTKYEYRDDGSSMPKGCAIRFTAQNLTAGASDVIHWIVENTGDEAAAADHLGHVTKGTSTTNWEDTAYKGAHRMICELRRGGRVIARGVRRVIIS